MLEDGVEEVGREFEAHPLGRRAGLLRRAVPLGAQLQLGRNLAPRAAATPGGRAVERVERVERIGIWARRAVHWHLVRVVAVHRRRVRPVDGRLGRLGRVRPPVRRAGGGSVD
jgi:hypothetical protein